MEVEEAPATVLENPKSVLDWKQNEKLIIINVHIEGLQREQVKIIFDEKSIELTIQEKEYNLKLQLAHPVLPKFCIYKVFNCRTVAKVLSLLPRLFF